MKRLVALVAVSLAGCHQPVLDQDGEAGAATLPEAPLPSPGVEIDFAKWPTATDQPIPVALANVYYCAAPAGPQIEAQRKLHGPHYQPAIVVRVNPEAIHAFKAMAAPMPVGTTIVKEKHNDLVANGPPAEFGAMIKREPGYDPAHGDWEYLYVTSTPEKQVTRGRLQSCIDCHKSMKEKDYLYRSYLPGQAGAVSKW
jgi:cytochrome P460